MKPDGELTLNSEQRDAVCCTNNTVVAAGAGSGKTMVLAKRYCRLVTEKGLRVPEILTLTFTKKAAAQMYRRIHRELTDSAAEGSGEKGRLAKQALEEFSLSRIQTLDSYCASIVKQAANRYGISPDFTIDEERCSAVAFDEALPFLIANREHLAVERLYMRKSPVHIAKNIFAAALYKYTHIDSLGSQGDDPKNDIKAQFAVICDQWKKQNVAIRKKLDELDSVYRGNEKYHPDIAPILRRYNDDTVAFPGENEIADFFGQLAEMPHKSAVEFSESHPLRKRILDVTVFLAELKGVHMSKGSPRNNPAKDIVWELRDLFDEFYALAVFCLQAGLIYSVLMLLSELRRRYIARRRAEGILTFSDVARLARTILLEQHDIRQSEKETFKAIMIDEFQDNNELQKDLLFFLAEKPDVCGSSVPSANDLCPDKLFFVGDEKQSVYLFRGADVSVFRKLKTELDNMELPLSTNYRSAPRLIGAFNSIFGGYKFDPEGKSTTAAGCPAVFAKDSPELPPFEASYTPLNAHKKTGGKLTLCILDKSDDESADTSADTSVQTNDERLSPVENEARYIAEKIRTLLDEKDDTGEHKYRPGDIAILFRSRSPQHYFEKHLILLNVPYTSENLSGFFYGGPVNDLMSVLRLVAYPTDRIAYAQMLRSPFAGLSMSGLTACLAVSDNENVAYPFGDEPVSRLSQEDRARYGHGQRVYQKITEMACSQNISSLVSELWFGEGYRYETEWNAKTAVLREMYDYLFHLAVQADESSATGPQGLAAFTDYIQTLAGEQRLNDIDIPLERQGAVHLMTIHKSKGLEFPVVFLCCCDKKGKNDTSDDIFATEVGLTLNPPLPDDCEDIKDIKRNYFWERSLAVEKSKRTAELRRLLYVGMTRAENELYLSGCVGVSNGVGEHDDFSRSLKDYVELQVHKAAEKKGGDGFVLNGDTFFGLCLPAFASHIPAGGGGSFFEVEKIPAYSEAYIRAAEECGARFANDRSGMNAFFGAAESYYTGADVLRTPKVARKHYAPTSSALKALTGEILPGPFEVSREYSGVGAADVFAKVEDMLKRYAKKHGEEGEKFNQGSFGTIAHVCVEALLAGKEAVIPAKLAGFLSGREAKSFLEAGKDLAVRFLQSHLGDIANKCDTRRSEFPFRSLVPFDGDDYFFINGVIDLVFEDGGTVYVVDLKTDVHEIPREHIAQMACYYRAACELFAAPAGKACRVWLYYLRTGHAVEVTEQASGHKFGGAACKVAEPYR